MLVYRPDIRKPGIKFRTIEHHMSYIKNEQRNGNFTTKGATGWALQDHIQDSCSFPIIPNLTPSPFISIHCLLQPPTKM